MVNKVTYLGFRGVIAAPLICPCSSCPWFKQAKHNIFNISNLYKLSVVKFVHSFNFGKLSDHCVKNFTVH